MDFGNKLAVSKQVVRYCLVGVGNTIVGLSCIYICMAAFGLGNVTANIIGFSIGSVLSYALNKIWTFNHRGSSFNSALLFSVVVAISYAFNLLVVVFSHDTLAINSYIAQALGNVTYSMLAFFGFKYVAFRNHTVNGGTSGYDAE